jgi:hypothetical protein
VSSGRAISKDVNGVLQNGFQTYFLGLASQTINSFQSANNADKDKKESRNTKDEK